jgi:hypothetical protein
MKWESFRNSLATSIGINLGTGLLGYFIFQLVGESRIMEILENHHWPFLLVMWFLSFILEGGLLVILKPSKWQFSLKAALLINTASYVWNAIALALVLLYFGEL